MSSKREMSFIAADLARVEALLRSMPAGRVIDRLSLEHRREELANRLREARTAAGRRPLACVEVLFEGEPVLTSVGIEAKFGTKALDAYQRALGASMASQAGRVVGQRGPLPQVDAKLLITGTVGGSFGFRLEEVTEQAELWDGSVIGDAVEEINEVLRGLAMGDEEFADAASDTDPRVVGAVRDFVSVLATNRATCRVVGGRAEVALPNDEAVQAAAERAAVYRVSEEDRPYQGTLIGVLPVARRFEHRLADGMVIRGRISKEIEDPEGLNALVDHGCTIHVRVTTLAKPERTTTTFTLLRIEQ